MKNDTMNAYCTLVEFVYLERQVSCLNIYGDPAVRIEYDWHSYAGQRVMAVNTEDYGICNGGIVVKSETEFMSLEDYNKSHVVDVDPFFDFPEFDDIPF